MTLDSATIPSGSLVDSTVQSIGTTYDDMGRMQTVTSYSGTDGGGTALNEVLMPTMGGATWLRSGRTPTASIRPPAQPAVAPTVEYTYADGANGGGVAAYLRLESVTYPNNRVVQYNYNDGPQAAINEVMSRLGSISNAGNTDTYAVESYLGLDNIVTEDYKDPQVKCDLSSGNYSGLDQFGRVSDMVWWQYGNSGNLTNKLDEFVYWHLDTEGDITGEVEQAQNMSQVQNGFGYDAMGRLASYSQQIGGERPRPAGTPTTRLAITSIRRPAGSTTSPTRRPPSTPVRWLSPPTTRPATCKPSARATGRSTTPGTGWSRSIIPHLHDRRAF